MKQYTVNFPGLGEITANKETIEKLAEQSEHLIHYSQTTDQFVALSEMHICHLENAVLQLFNDTHFENPWQIALAVEDPLYKEWERRAEHGLLEEQEEDEDWEEDDDLRWYEADEDED